MKLMDMPDDILLEVMKLLDAVDVVISRRVSPRLRGLSGDHSIWSYIFRQVCKEHGVALPIEQLSHYPVATLEYYACRPARFQSIATGLATQSAKSVTPRRQFILPIASNSKIHLVKGGRWLLGLSTKGVLNAWDLEPSMASSPGWSPLDFSGGPASSSTSPADNRCRLYAQSEYDPQGLSLVDAVATPDGVHLNVLLWRSSENHTSSSMVVLSLDLSSDVHDPETVKEFAEVSSWDLDWVRDSSAFYSFGSDIVLLARRDIQQPIWMWNWKTSQARKMLLQVPTTTEHLLQTKIVSDTLLAAHRVDGNKCMISLYPLPRLDWDHEPALVEVLSAPLHSSSLSSLDCVDQPSDAEPLAPAFTSRFREMAHPSGPRLRVQPHGLKAPTSMTLGFQTTYLDLDSEGAWEPIHSTPFIPGRVTISEPLWIVAPSVRKAITIPLREGSIDPGVFLVAVAIESTGDSVTVRTRLHYTLRVDLRMVAESLEEGDSGFSTRTTATVGMDTSTAVADKLGSLKLRGRISFPRDSVLNQTTSIVMSGKKAIVSVWNAPDGIHMQSSSIKSNASTSTAVTSSIRRSPSPERRHALLNFRRHPQRGDSASSETSLPTSAAREYDRRPKNRSSSTRDPLGSDTIVYTWPEKKKTSGPAFDPQLVWQARALSMFGNRRMDVRRSWSTMDSISGRLIVSDGDEDWLQVVDYV